MKITKIAQIMMKALSAKTPGWVMSTVSCAATGLVHNRTGRAVASAIHLFFIVLFPSLVSRREYDDVTDPQSVRHLVVS